MANSKRPTPNTRPAKKPPAGGARSAPPPPPPPPVKSKAPGYIAGGIAVVVIVAAIVAVAAGGGSDDPSGDASPVTTSAVPATSSDATAGPGAPGQPGEYQPVTVVGAALPRLEDPDDDPAIGETPPTLIGATFEGQPITIDPGTGRAQMIVFLAHWCPHCNREVPRLVEWYEGGGVPDDLDVIGVSTGADKSAPNWPPSEWIVDQNWPWPVMADSEDQDAAVAYGLPAYPYFVLIGSDGTVKYRATGELEIDELEQILADHLT